MSYQEYINQKYIASFLMPEWRGQWGVLESDEWTKILSRVSRIEQKIYNYKTSRAWHIAFFIDRLLFGTPVALYKLRQPNATE